MTQEIRVDEPPMSQVVVAWNSALEIDKGGGREGGGGKEKHASLLPSLYPYLPLAQILQGQVTEDVEAVVEGHCHCRPIPVVF